MFYLAIIAVAIYAVLNIPLSLMPDLSYPRLTIVCMWSDASPEEVEANITSQIEEIGSTIAGISNIRSTSYGQRSVVNLEFARNTDMDFARFELNEKLQLLHDKLPEDVVPRIQEYVPREFREEVFLQYGVSGPYTSEQLREYIEENLRYPVSSVEGVSAFEIAGDRKAIVRILLKDQDLNQVTIYQVQQKLREYGNRSSVSSFIDNGREYFLEIKDRFSTLEDIKNLKISRTDGRVVQLHQIATVALDNETPFNLMRYNGMPQVTFTVFKENTANSLKLAGKLKKLITDRKTDFPDDVLLIKLEDESEKISSDLNILYQRGFFSLLIIFLVLWIFLKHYQSTFLVIATIIFSTALTFILMFFLKISLNMLSLAGLALGFGMMVDNSIVVYENIFRYQNLGYSRFEASMQGVKEVSLPITASTLTTIIVFAPFLYMHGDLKIFYLPFVYSMVLALLSSLLVSFTFIPLVAYRFLKINSFNKGVTGVKSINRELNIYQKILKFLLRFRWTWLAIVVLFLGFSIWIYVDKVEKGIVWQFPRDDFIGIRISLPVGSNIEQTDKLARMFEDKIVDNENIESVKTQVWTRYAYLKVDFSEEVKKTAAPLMIREKLKAYATNFGNSRIWIRGFGPSFGGGGFSISNFSLKLTGYDYLSLKTLAEELALFMQKTSKRVQNIDTNAIGWWKDEKLFEYLITFKREKLSIYQMDINTIVNQVYGKLNSAYGGFSRKINEEELKIQVKETGFKDFSIDDLRSIVISNLTGGQVKLSEVAEIKRVQIMPEIERENELYTRRINFDFRGSYKKGNKFKDGLIETYPLPDGYAFVDEEAEFDTDADNNQLIYLLIFAILLVYMSLSSLFESLKYPFIILLTIPLAFVGVAYMFYFNDETFASSARIGLVLLAGIVVNNSIILVDHINLIRKKGIDITGAILQAARDRMRPILMTSLTTITALLPMLIRADIGKNDFWRLLSLSTIGGLVTSTFFVLTFIPVLYYILSRKKK